MIKKRECTLCGGRVTNGVCTECGLDNTRTRMYQETEFLSEDQRDQMYEKNHTAANKKFFDDLKEEEKRVTQSVNQPRDARNPRGVREPRDAREPKKSSSIIGKIVLIYAIIYIASILLSMLT